MNVLLIDDDVELCDLLSSFLSSEGFNVSMMHYFDQERWNAFAERTDILILDIGLPRLNGLEALKRIRSQSKIPVLMLTARGDDLDRILGLELGADDYLSKPCNPRELVARLRAILRRSTQSHEDSDAELISVSGVALDSNARKVMVDGEEITLTSTEFNILKRLMQEAGRVVTKQALSQYALGRQLLPTDRSIDVHLSNIRRKLGEERLRTMRNQGYQFVRY
jgi:DNA-binding response OmpR family regulator